LATHADPRPPTCDNPIGARDTPCALFDRLVESVGSTMNIPPPAVVGMPLEMVDTPALIVDLDVLRRNIDTMATAVRGVHLRPHAKSHKCPDIARLQIAAGAVGICCQKVAEAEAFVAAGIDDVLITNEIVGADKLARLAVLAKRASIGVLVDDVANVAALGVAARAADARINVLVEIDVGANRCGVAPGEAAAALAQRIADQTGLRFAGLHAYQGSAQHLRTPDARRAAVLRAIAWARDTKRLIEQRGLACTTVTGAGTGTYALERDSGLYTELQPGSYVFMDADYGRNTIAGGDAVFAQSLYVWTTVMSHPTSDRAVVDAGLKAFAVDSGLPVIARCDGVAVVKASDEHAVLAIDSRSAGVHLGDKLRLIPGHCDPTVNLHDWIVGVRDGTVECVWPVSARGAFA
jgi:3-hydroxy-D-aspartate aldolase